MRFAEEAHVQPGACHVFSIGLDSSQLCHIVIVSRLVMARPVVFRINHQQLDVFHG
jgi:hypothetical protein